MTDDLTLSALSIAVQHREIDLSLIHHSDQGSQYTSGEYQQMLKDWGIEVSMNDVGTWYDNAPMESFFGTPKSEWVHHQKYRTRDEARTDLFYYVVYTIDCPHLGEPLAAPLADKRLVKRLDQLGYQVSLQASSTLQVAA